MLKFKQYESDQSAEQLRLGIKTEKEHLNIYTKMKDFLSRHNLEMPMSEEEFAEDIAKAHLEEIPTYYDKLIEIEKKYELESEASTPHPDEEEDDN